MEVDENGFFREAASRICSTLDIASALHRSLLFLKDYLPIDLMILWIYEESMGALRKIAVATPEEGHTTDTIMLLAPDIREKLLKMDVPHRVIARPGGTPVVMRIVNRPEDDPVALSLKQYFEPQNYSSLVMYLDVDGRRLGTLFVRAKDRDRYSVEHARLLSLLQEPFAIATANALNIEELRKARDLIRDGRIQIREALVSVSGEKIVGADSGLKGVMDMVRQVSSLHSPVLIFGETGVGKDVIASAIHQFSQYKDGPFVKVNCGAIPDTLIDSELFGHEKGAFTGANLQKRGYFERANKGTIFLDEIGDLPLNAQVRLLRVLQFKEVQRVGGGSPVRLDIRVIAATHRNLEAMVEAGLFREDLWFRLNVFPILIPPLRHRKEDIPALLHFLIAQKAIELKLNRIPSLTPGTAERLMAYDWPGNVRELENVIERALILCRGDELSEDAFLFRDGRTGSAVEESGSIMTLDEAVSAHIRKALRKSGGKIHGPGGAAHLLGVNASTLRNRMDRLAIRYGRRCRAGSRQDGEPGGETSA